MGGDPQLSVSGGRIFVLARDFDSVFEFDPKCGAPLGKRATGVVTGMGSSNPQDVAVTRSGDLWVPKYNVPELALLAKDGRTRKLDLRAYDTDGNPQASAIAIDDFGSGEKAYIAAQKLDDDDWPRSTRPSALLRFDVATETFEASLELKTRNPFGRLVFDRSRYYLASAGSFGVADEADAGVEEVDPQAFSSRLLVSERQLGGSVVQVAVHDGCGAAIIADATARNRTALVSFDAKNGEVLSTFATPLFGPTEGYDLWALAWDGAELYLGDQRRGARGYPIHRFLRSQATCELVKNGDPLLVSQKPLALRSLRQTPQ